MQKSMRDALRTGEHLARWNRLIAFSCWHRVCARWKYQRPKSRCFQSRYLKARRERSSLMEAMYAMVEGWKELSRLWMTSRR